LYLFISCVALFYSDSPYGITDAPWDKCWDKKKLDKIMKQFGATQTSEYCVACIWHNPLQLTDFTDTLADNDYGSPVCYYWHKSGHHTPTPVSSYTSSVEQAIIAFKPNRNSCPFNASKNPRKRHNFIECSGVTKYELDGNGNAINKCQKPPDLSRQIALTHCVPGEWALNVGPGSGGCLQGLVQAGVNVVAIESDVKQFELLQGTVWKWKENGTFVAPVYSEDIDYDEKQGEEEEEDKLPSTPASNLSTTSANESQHSNPSAPMGGDEPVGIQCAGCGELIPDPETAVTCESGSCGDQEFYHPKCTAFVDGMRKCQACFLHENTLSPPVSN
jgi:hypothetical protein